MNVVQAAEGRQKDFEEAFLNRERLVDQVEGFKGFELLRREDANEYVVLTRWASREAFQGWLKSDHFKRAHANTRSGDSPATSSELRTYEVVDVEVPA
jgi:heme-degrading monooxygenase HmoA